MGVPDIPQLPRAHAVLFGVVDADRIGKSDVLLLRVLQKIQSE